MRALGTAVLIGLAVVAAAGAASAPTAAPGYRLTTLDLPGSIFSGLARDGDDLIVTDLATGRLLKRRGEGPLAPFGPVFPHGLDVIGDPTGPYRVARVGNGLVLAQGWTPVDSDEGPLDHALLRLDVAGAVSVIASDFWNPFAFTGAADGGYYVVDAAKNSVEHLAADGATTTVASFSRMSGTVAAMQGLSPTEFAAGSPYEFDAVPTGIALDRDRLLVALFGGFPFLAGAGKVVAVATAGGAVESIVDDLNAPVDVAPAPDGRLLVLEHGLYDQATGFRADSGRLLSIDLTSGARTVILDRLTRPASLLVWDETTVVIAELAGRLDFLTKETAPAP